MDEYELLVHISAPARAQDDRKYLSLAQSIVDFEAAAVTMITETNRSPVVAGSNTSPTVVLSEQQSSPTGLRGDFAKNTQKTLSDLDPNLPRPLPSFHSSDVSATGREATSSPEQQRAPWLNTFTNPPYKNPCRSRNLLETPRELSRPGIATGVGSTNIQVPFTGTKSHYAHSEVNLATSFRSHISNSQPSFTMSEHEAVPASSAPPAITSVKSNPTTTRARSLSQTSETEQQPRKRARREQDLVTHQTTIIPPAVPGQPFFLRDRSMDWSSSPTRSSSSQQTCSSSSASPSQPKIVSNRDAPAASQDNSTNDAEHPIVIHSSGSAPQSRTLETKLSSSKHRTVGLDSLATPVSQQRKPDVHAQSTIEKLPKEVNAPEPPAGEGRYSSHITQHMHELVEILPLDRFFRPTEVKRDVKVLERGWWTMEITIASQETIQEVRKSPSKEEKMKAWDARFPGATSAERLEKYYKETAEKPLLDIDYPGGEDAVGLWTEQEFVAFWNSFSLFVKGGRGGWGTRMVRDRLDNGDSEAEIHRIRIFTWGELLAHAYIAIFVLSGKISERIPMQWMEGNGNVVVQMAGTRGGRGKLRPWSRKGLDGEQGYWGVADDGEQLH